MNAPTDDTDWTILHGDAAERLTEMPDDHFDAMVTDPPSGIGFMSQDWDDDRGGREQWVDWLANILSEARRTLKPGAPCLVWSLPKRSHWTGLAIERAGLIIEDQIAHMFGSGMPKGGHLDKKVDRAMASKGDREVVREHPQPAGNDGHGTSFNMCVEGVPDSHNITAPSSPEAQRWNGTSTTLAPAREDWWLCRKPTETITAEQLHEATGRDWWCTRDVERDGRRELRLRALHEDVETLELTLEDGEVVEREAEPYEAWSSDSMVANALVHDAGPLQIDGCRVGIDEGDPEIRRNHADHDRGPRDGVHEYEGLETSEEKDLGRHTSQGRWPAHLGLTHHPDCEDECHPRCPVRIVDEQSGECPIGGDIQSDMPSDPGYQGGLERQAFVKPDDTGGASRFFPRFRYTAKASTNERDAGLTDDDDEPARLEHTTVKPVELMRWLVRLVTPTGGEVLDPFAGSGTTGIGCLLEGVDFTGVEADEGHVDEARQRLTFWQKHGADAPDVWREHCKQQKAANEAGQLDLMEDSDDH